MPLLLPRRVPAFAVVALALVGASAADAARPRVAILPITGEGVLLDDLAPVEDALRAGTKELSSYRLLSRENTLRELESARELGLHCSPGQTSCLVRLGLVSEIDLLLVPRASSQGRFLSVVVSLIDVADEREVARVGRIVDRRAVKESVGRLAFELLEQDPDTGTLVLDVAPADAVVEIDGEVRGRAPLFAPVSGLRAGRHRLLVRLDGYRSVRATVDVRARTVSGYVIHLSARAPRASAPVDVAPQPKAVTSAEDDEAIDPRILGGGVTAGVGAIALVGAGVLGASALAGDDEGGLARVAALVAGTAGVLLVVGGLTFVGVAALE